MISFVSVFLRLKKIASNLLRGFAMGIADVVPGVSGGTIALVLGIYEQLLENISNCALSLGKILKADFSGFINCLLYTSPSPRDRTRSRMPSSA